MDLDENTRADLSAFFARRFPSAEARGRLAGAAGLPAADLPTEARAAWDTLVERAITRGRLLALVDAAAAAAPGDPLLVEVRRLLGGPPATSEPPSRAVTALLVGVVALGIAVAGFFVTAGPDDSLDDPDVAATVEAAKPMAARSVGPLEPAAPTPATDGPPADAPPANAAPTEPPVEAPAAEAPPVEAVAPPPPREEAPTALAEATPPTPAATPAPSGCEGPEGTILGWWYTNRGNPGAVGETVTVPTHANVRVDFPRAENRYARGATVLCTLREGTQQRLTHAPVHAGGDQWWVPLAGGDLL